MRIRQLKVQETGKSRDLILREKLSKTLETTTGIVVHNCFYWHRSNGEISRKRAQCLKHPRRPRHAVSGGKGKSKQAEKKFGEEKSREWRRSITLLSEKLDEP